MTDADRLRRALMAQPLTTELHDDVTDICRAIVEEFGLDKGVAGSASRALTLASAILDVAEANDD